MKKIIIIGVFLLVLYIDYKVAKDLEEREKLSEEIKEYEENSEIIYQIEEGEKIIVISGSENEECAKIKKWLAAISPNKFSDKYLNRFILYTKDEDTEAFAIKSETQKNKWDIYVNLNAAKEIDEKQMVFTLVHEFAHIITLNSSQVNNKSCDYFIQEMCINSEAYLISFYNKYWKNKFDEFAVNSDVNYEKKPTAFVTEYAATSPTEDIAESFVNFVFEEKPKPQKTVAEQKINFFYSYPELVRIRKSIRSELKSFIGKRGMIIETKHQIDSSEINENGYYDYYYEYDDYTFTLDDRALVARVYTDELESAYFKRFELDEEIYSITKNDLRKPIFIEAIRYLRQEGKTKFFWSDDDNDKDGYSEIK